MNKVKKLLMDNIIFVIIAVIMAIVYGIGMFTNKPWYDELYTYYYFISKGPIYAAIHWPVPNNHIGYSVLSAFLNYIFNPVIGLRGIAYISSVVNIILLYAIVVKLFNERIYGIFSVVAFGGTYLVYSLAFQGRGYSLTTMCFLVAIYSLVKICCNEDEKEVKRLYKYKPYILFAGSLVWGLYSIPSSLYWVIPTCLVGGFCLLMQKRYKEMRLLIYFALGAAIVTFGLYTIVWLAIGSNLLIKDPSTVWYGMGHVSVIIRSPFSAFKTGMEYMLATPYIQSIERTLVIKGLWDYMRDLFNLFIGGAGTVITLIMCVAMICSGAVAFSLRKKSAERKTEFFSATFVVTFILTVPLMMLIQSVLPYKRVFSFIGVVWAVALSFLLKYCLTLLKIGDKNNTKKILFVMITLFAIFVAFKLYRADVPLADRENDIEQLLNLCESNEEFNVHNIDSIFYTDDYQKYVLKFYYDVEPAEMTIEEAAYVMVSNDLLSPDGQKEWPMLTDYSQFNMDYVEEEFEIIGYTDKYILYRRHF